MELRLFGSTKRFVARIGQGTWFIEDADRDIAIAALRRGLDLGMTHIDTAELYGGGAAEELVGEAIAGRRNEVFLVSKVLPENASQSGTRLACERSLARLDTDRLDCYLLHWRGRHPLEETIAGFEDLQRAGKILSWGVSDVPDLRDALAIAGQGEGRLACNQVLYHLQERAIEHAVLPWCERHGVAVTAYSPFRPWEFPGVRYRWRASARKDRSSLRSNSPSSGAGFSDTPPVALRDPQGIHPGACRRECRRWRFAAVGLGCCSDRCRLPAWASAACIAGPVRSGNHVSGRHWRPLRHSRVSAAEGPALPAG
jgi:diketogulonate reductase-like aldo/keto reductase